MRVRDLQLCGIRKKIATEKDITLWHVQKSITRREFLDLIFNIVAIIINLK